jgi:hypothetical protein
VADRPDEGRLPILDGVMHFGLESGDEIATKGMNLALILPAPGVETQRLATMQAVDFVAPSMFHVKQFLDRQNSSH